MCSLRSESKLYFPLLGLAKFAGFIPKHLTTVIVSFFTEVITSVSFKKLKGNLLVNNKE